MKNKTTGLKDIDGTIDERINKIECIAGSGLTSFAISHSHRNNMEV